jgi:tetratricopeptide (TPR) repeat protein
MLEEQDAEYYLLEASIYDANEDRPNTRRALDSAVQAEPNNHITYFNRAKYNQEDAALLSDVMNDLSRTLEIQPSYRPARELRALMLQRTGDRRGAVAELARLLEYYPDDATLRLRVAGAYLAIDRPLVAKTVLQEGADRDPDEPGWPIELGKVEYMLGDIESAQGHFREAYNRLESAGIGLLLAETLIMPGDTQDVPYAMRLLERHREELGQNPAYHAVLARGLAADGKTDEARLALVRSWGLNANREQPDPDQRSRWFEAAKVVYSNDYGQLRRLVDEVSGGSPPPALLVSMAEYLVTTRSAPDADVEALRLVDEFRRIAADNPEIDPAVRINEVLVRGAVLFGLTQFQSLVEMYEDALENVFPPVPQSGYDRWYQQRLELLNNLAYLLAERLDRPNDALVYAARAAEAAPDNPNILDTLGWVQHQTGDSEAARATLSQSIEIREMSANLYHMSAVLHALGETAEARLYLDRAKRMTPRSDAIRLRMLSELEQQINAGS